MTRISSSPPRLTACRGRLQRGPILTLSNMDSRLRGNDEFGVTRHPFIQSSIVGQRSVRVFAAHTSRAPLKNEPRVDELRFVPGDNGVEQAGAALALPGRDHGADRKRAQGIADGEGALRGILATREREHVGTTLT